MSFSMIAGAIFDDYTERTMATPKFVASWEDKNAFSR